MLSQIKQTQKINLKYLIPRQKWPKWDQNLLHPSKSKSNREGDLKGNRHCNKRPSTYLISNQLKRKKREMRIASKDRIRRLMFTTMFKFRKLMRGLFKTKLSISHKEWAWETINEKLIIQSNTFNKKGDQLLIVIRRRGALLNLNSHWRRIVMVKWANRDHSK